MSRRSDHFSRGRYTHRASQFDTRRDEPVEISIENDENKFDDVPEHMKMVSKPTSPNVNECRHKYSALNNLKGFK